MNLAIPAGGGIVARVLHAALKVALKRQEALISESELAQVARVIVVGNNNKVTINPPVGMPSSTRGGYDVDQIVARCFEIVLRQPGLSVIYAINKDGERFIKIENMRDFRLPDESQLIVYGRESKDTPGGYHQPNKIENIQEKPAAADGAEDTASEDSTSARSRRGSRTAREYAEYARRMMELPDNPDGVDPEEVL